MQRKTRWGAWLGGIASEPRLYLAVLPVTFPLMLVTHVVEPLGFAPQPIAVDYVATATQSDPLPAHPVFDRINPGDTLVSCLERQGISRTEAHAIATEFAKTVNPRSLKPGQVLRYDLDDSGAIQAIALSIPSWGEMRAVRSGQTFTFESHEARRWTEQVLIAGTVQTSLFEAIRASGEDPEFAQELADVFRWDVDFFRLQPGDSFVALATRQYAGAQRIGYGPILAARFTHRGEVWEAFHFTDAKGVPGYFDATGRPLKKQFLRAPLRFSRVTSGFTKRRFHPVLKVFRPHHGVDYGAPTGTPVMATADGVVGFAGWGAGEGRFVRLKHDGSIETNYLHLSRIASGVRSGARVRQGQVIGYVGATGLATAPHLDYRIKVRGKWVNPLKVGGVPLEPLRGKSLEDLQASAAPLRARLDQQSPLPEAEARRR